MLVLFANRHLNGERSRVQAFADALKGRPEVGADTVHLVDEADARDVVAVGLAPDRLRLALDAGDGVEHNNAPVQDTEAAFHFDGEVHVAGGIYDVDLVVVPRGRRGGGGDRDAALSLLRHPVHDGSAGVDITDLVRDPRMKEDPLCHGGLAGIDVRDDPYVSYPFDGHRLTHISYLHFLEGNRLVDCHWPRQFLAPTTCSERRPCWLRPCGACLHAF